jgi:hypothetical protein
MDKAFQVWSSRKVKFLAFPATHGNVTIIDENGKNYGSWKSLFSFRVRQIRYEISSIGKCSLRKHDETED